jgi:hypothetical protein
LTPAFGLSTPGTAAFPIEISPLQDSQIRAIPFNRLAIIYVGLSVDLSSPAGLVCLMAEVVGDDSDGRRPAPLRELNTHRPVAIEQC